MFLAGIQDELVSGYPTNTFGYDKTGMYKFLTGDYFIITKIPKIN
jgi:hypothetical protein